MSRGLKKLPTVRWKRSPPTIRSVLSRIDWALERPAYNLVLHTAPLTGEADQAFHWHLEILPRVTRYSGLEWGSGMHRNPVAPEEAARVLRDG